MGGIPLPALAIRPPEQPDLLNEVGKITQLKGAMQNQQLGQQRLQEGQLSMQEAQRKQQEAQAFRQAYVDVSKSMPNATQSDRIDAVANKLSTNQNVSPETLQALQLHSQKLKTDTAAADEATLKLRSAQIDNLRGAFKPIYDLPANTPSDQLESAYQQQRAKILQNPQAYGVNDPSTIPPQFPGKQAGQFLMDTMIGEGKQLEEQKNKSEAAKSAAQGDEATVNAQKNRLIVGGMNGQGMTAEQQATTAQGAARIGIEKRNSYIEAQRAKETQRHNLMSEAQLTPDALDMAAQQFASTGQMPNVGRGGAVRSQVMNAAAAKYPAIDLASNAAAYKANQQSLEGLQKNLDSVTAFESTANKNLDLFLNQAKNIVDTGSPLLNKPLRTLNQQVLGSADQAAVNAARQVAVNEIAKVTGSPGLTGQLSDTARKEVADFNPASATLAQTYKVAQVLRQDMSNRHQSYADQIGAIQQRLKNSTTGGQGAQQQSQPTSAPQTATGPNGHKIMVKDGRWVDAQTGAPIQ